MRRLSLVLAVSAALLALGATPAFAADKDCKDFSSQAAAQAYFEAHGGSPSNNVDRLDADHDGQACEAFNYGSTSPAVSPVSSSSGSSQQAGTEQASTESLPRTGTSGMLAPLGVALVLIGGMAVLASRRRRRALR
ncbi:MAG TPA: excalibur calcium-binding domain-containing protein [Actinomycetes bacterium]